MLSWCVISALILLAFNITALPDTLTSYQSNLQSLVTAERAFAQLSRETSTRNAFIKSFAADGVIFPGERVNAIAHWTARPKEKDWLNWSPHYADVAASGDLGYNTGPFLYKPDRSDSSLGSYGSFFSVWKKEKGEWKVWLDMGVGAPAGVIYDVSDTVTSIDTKGRFHSCMLPKRSVTEAESSFVAVQNAEGISTYQSVLGEQCHIYRPRLQPAREAQSAMSILSARGERIQFQITETKVAESGEFAVAYGTANITLPADAPVRELEGHYIRVWKVYDGEWKIDVDVLIGGPKK